MSNEHTPSNDPRINNLNQLAEHACRAVFVRLLALPDDPQAERVSIEVAPEASGADGEPGIVLVNWPESSGAPEAETVRDAVLAALPDDFKGWKVEIT
jgi:hypothetical protein